jgi:hypothetical protein
MCQSIEGYWLSWQSSRSLDNPRPAIADLLIRSRVQPAAEPAYQYRRVLRAEPAATRRRPARPRRRTGVSVACQGFREADARRRA